MTRDFGPEVFAGAAFYYARYRPRYPEKLLSDIAGDFGLDGRGQLLDLGCGTGELAVPLAGYFEKVLAVDPDPDMLAEGRRRARKAGIDNISWQKGSSKELNSLKGPFKAVVMGQSFHWMDQEPVLDCLYELLESGGGLAIIGTEPVKQGPQGVKKDQAVKKLVHKYLGPARRAGANIYTPPPKKYAELLPASEFRTFHERHYDVMLARSVDQIVGHTFSLSWALKAHFGSQADDFEAELRAALEALSTDGKITEKFRFTLYTLAR